MLGEESGVVYTLVGPNGDTAVFNDSTDSDYAGNLHTITGILSSEVRENTFDRPQGDGGVHGNFYFGRKPVVMDIEVVGATRIVRNQMLDRIRLASRALRSDSTLTWTPSGGEEVSMGLRLQQPPRVAGGWMKSVQLQMVSPEPYAQSTTLYSEDALFSTGTLEADYDGDMPGYLQLTITGPATDPVITNAETGEDIGLDGTIAASTEAVIVMTPGVAEVYDDGTRDESLLDYDNSVFWGLVNGANTIDFTATGTTGASSLEVEWRNAYG